MNRVDDDDDVTTVDEWLNGCLRNMDADVRRFSRVLGCSIEAFNSCAAKETPASCSLECFVAS